MVPLIILICALVVFVSIREIIKSLKPNTKGIELENRLDDMSAFAKDFSPELKDNFDKNNFRDFSYEQESHLVTEYTSDLISYIKTLNLQPFRLTLEEEEALLDSELWNKYSVINMSGVYKVNNTRIITLVEATERFMAKPVSHGGEPTFETHTKAALTIKTNDGELLPNDKRLLDKLKSKPEIEIVRESTCYYCMPKKQVTKPDLDLFLS